MIRVWCRRSRRRWRLTRVTIIERLLLSSRYRRFGISALSIPQTEKNRRARMLMERKKIAETFMMCLFSYSRNVLLFLMLLVQKICAKNGRRRIAKHPRRYEIIFSALTVSVLIPLKLLIVLCVSTTKNHFHDVACKFEKRNHYHYSMFSSKLRNPNPF